MVICIESNNYDISIHGIFNESIIENKNILLEIDTKCIHLCSCVALLICRIYLMKSYVRC